MYVNSQLESGLCKIQIKQLVTVRFMNLIGHTPQEVVLEWQESINQPIDQSINQLTNQ